MNVLLNLLEDFGQRFALEGSHNQKDAGGKRWSDGQFGCKFATNHRHGFARKTAIEEGIPIVTNHAHVQA